MEKNLVMSLTAEIFAQMQIILAFVQAIKLLFGPDLKINRYFTAMPPGYKNCGPVLRNKLCKGVNLLAYQFMFYEESDHVAVITLNRPEVNNALNAGLMEEIVRALEESGKNPEVRVIVVRGAGDKAFCAGADLGGVGEKSGSVIEMRVHLSRYADLITALADVGKPTIAAVQGYALAGGCGLAAACDLTVASEKARFGVPEVNVGLWGMIITAPIFRAVGMKKGLELFYTGKHIDSHEAEKIGLVNKVSAHGSLIEETMILAGELASKSPLAMALGREAYYTSRDMEYFKSVKYLREMVTPLACSEDCREGIAAFKEKRKPRWQGR